MFDSNLTHFLKWTQHFNLKTMRKLSFIFLMLVAFVFTVSAQRTFKHPGSILAASDLERIKTHVNAGDEPWASLWKEMQADNIAKPTYTPMLVQRQAEVMDSVNVRRKTLMLP